MKKTVFLIMCAGVFLALTISCVTSGSGSSDAYYMPPSTVTKYSKAETNFWSGNVTIKSGTRHQGLWEISYQIEVPELQLQEVPIYIPYPVKSNDSQSNSILSGLVTVESSGGGKQMRYWMVHMYTLRWMYPQAKITVFLRNTSDKTVDISKMRIEVQKTAGVNLLKTMIGNTVGPKKMIAVELFSIDFNNLSDDINGTVPVSFRFVDMPMALNPNGTIQEISLHEDQFQLTRTPHTYTSALTLTAVHTAKAMLKEDNTPHYRNNVSIGQYHTTEYFELAPIHFKIDFKGDPLVTEEPILWDEDRVADSSPYNFGEPQRVFKEGIPPTVEAWSEEM